MVILFAVTLAAVLSWSSSSKQSPGGAPVTTTTVAHSTTTSTTVARASVKVQVANGTSTAGVATRVT